MNQKVTQINQPMRGKAKQTLSDLEMIDSAIQICYEAIQKLEFQSKEGAVEAFVRMSELRLKYIDWLDNQK
ncbi:hypothetical protein Syn7502_01483 [Synechococcus sp. PCC 7502]|uniref:hypothetical protein n=1 Tax=Synechococcus sp. PCC 7502 TaxID=1173263 RepID=UPI00029FB7BE|nr:hypothetical protein [Synechococcus sp. PCC 7502]AFY73551.1 hypothetical protein Syn7502_01483 [Synechococcus sp. PCC 7502]